MFKESHSPGSFLGLRSGMNLAPIANAIARPNMKPLASIPGGNKKQVSELVVLQMLTNISYPSEY